jgi:preprotein translocase subunit SecF
MELIRHDIKIDFIGKRWWFFSITLVLQVACMASLAFKGFNYGIEFTGGTVVQVTYEKPRELHGVRQVLEKIGHGDAQIQQFTAPYEKTFSIRLKSEGDAPTAAAIDAFLAKFQEADSANPFRVDRKDFVGPAVGKHLFRQAMFAVVGSLILIILYVAFRFSNLVWGVAGVLALAHDVVAVSGLYSMLGSELNLVLIAAILTIAGYSMHDTIVVYDRMREKMRLMRRESLGDVINASINETLSRSIITSLTTFIAVVTLFFIGGHVIHDFSIGMIFGIIVGTYSSVAVAAPIVYEWENFGRGAAPAPAPAAPAQPGAPVGAAPAPQNPQQRPRQGKRRR